MPDLGSLQTFLLSLIPGLFWVTYLRSLSAGRVCVWWHWCVALLAGWASTQLTLFVSDLLQVDLLERLPYIGSLVFFILGVGLVEEGAKALCTLLALKVPGLIRGPLSALQLSGGVALGFATAENILYASRFGDSVLLVRFASSTLAHILFSALWGFALGSRVFRLENGDESQRTPWGQFFVFLGLSSLAHGLFDWFLMSNRPVLALIVLLVLWLGFREAALGAFLQQEYSRKLPFATESCRYCSILTRAEGNYCSHCGESLREVTQEIGSEVTSEPVLP